MKTSAGSGHIDEYTAGFPADLPTLPKALRQTNRQAAPEAEETLEHAMPTYVLNGHLESIHAGRSTRSCGPYGEVPS